jgi:phage terminase small subunit
MRDAAPRKRRKATALSARTGDAPLKPVPAPLLTAASAGAVSSPITPLAYMLGVMNDKEADDARRDRMAIAAAPFVHKRVVDTPEGKKEVAKNTAARAGKVGRFATPPAPLRLVADNLRPDQDPDDESS